MEHQSIAAVGVIAACFVLWAMAAGRLTRLGISAPIFFVVLGVAATHGPITLVHLQLNGTTIRLIAEFTLAVVLFSDASSIDLRRFRKEAAVPARLLVIGLPLTIALGAVLAYFVLGGITIWVAAAVAAIVAPTDAALGASIMQDTRVPAAIREVLNVESGLNDGIATPFVNLFLAGAVSAAAVRDARLATAAVDLLGGAALGAGIGLVGALLLRTLRTRGLLVADALKLGSLGLAVCAYAAAVLWGVNGFVAAFVAGATFGTAMAPDEAWRGFAEEIGTVLSLTVWFIFGAAMLVSGLDDVSWRTVAFALLALTVIRMAPVALSLIGSGLDRASVLFVGWFGPRGLASVVFGLVAVDALTGRAQETTLAAVTLTVALSVLLHGVTAGVGATWFARREAPTATVIDDGGASAG